MATKMVLRCQYGGGQRKVLNGLTSTSTLSELTEAIFTITGVPAHRQRVMSGFPPKELDVSKGEQALNEVSIRSGDTLIVEENKDTAAVAQVVTEAPKQQVVADEPKLVRKVVPADNSCLFASISFVVLSGETAFASDLRVLAATCIQDDPTTYNEAFLGMPNADYCKWLSTKDKWGGAIELNVFSRYYQTEINVADVQSGRIDRYGENENYGSRVFLLYDGIHYDPMGLESKGEIIQTVFPCSAYNMQVEALAIAEDCKKKHQFTDLHGFSLRCLVCRTPLTGQTQAQEHAKQTGHMNFGEV